MTNPEIGSGRILLASAGLIVWASAFVVLYGGLSLGCEAGMAGASLTVWLAVAWVGHLAVLGWLQWKALGDWKSADVPDAGFLSALTCLIAAVGILSTVVVGFPILVLPPCS